MIKEIKQLLQKYKEVAKKSEYISIGQVINDLYQLESEARLKKIPKKER